MSQKLSLLDESSDDSDDGFSINKDYAKKYDNWRKLEEMQKLKDLSQDVSDSSSSSDDEEEPVVDKDFYRAWSLIKAKDPRVYDKNYHFFKDEPLPKKAKVKKEKPMFMKDYQRKLILERNGELSDEEDSEALPKSLTYKEKEEELIRNFKEAANSDDSEEDGDGAPSSVQGASSNLFQVRVKSKSEEQKDDEDYKQWLENDTDMKHLNKEWSDPNLDDKEKFLRDYFLNKWYLEKNADEIPKDDEDDAPDATTLSEDEKVLEEQETFEHKYNFRFEEPDEEFIKRYPRITGDSLRRTDPKRKQRREDYTERKKKEKEQKQEELKRLKALKRKEIEEKFSKLKEITGKELNFDESDMDSDFNPDKHDMKMRELFDDEYYNVEEMQKPEFEYDEDLDDEKWDDWTRDQESGPQEEQDEGDEDANIEEESVVETNVKSEFEQEMIDSTAGRKKKGRKKSLFAKIMSQPKPAFDPEGKSFDEYLEDYYKLDYEDIIGDQPVRYKYRKVIPNDFGLTVDEILSAQDKELNRWCSIKKTHQYRRDEDEMYDVQAFQKKAQNFVIKKKILASVYAPPKEEGKEAISENAEEQKKKKKRSKKKKRLDASGNTTDIACKNLSNSEPIIADSQSKEEKCTPPDDSLELAHTSEKTSKLEDSVDDNFVDTNKKRKKKKRKNIQNDSSNSINSAHLLNLDETNINESVGSVMERVDGGKNGTKKRKRKASKGSEFNEATVPKTKRLDTKSDEPNNSTINASGDASNGEKRKRKRNRNRKNKKAPSDGKHNTSEFYKKNVSTSAKTPNNPTSDKRLGLSDERLAAFGINPKKFKNKIIYGRN